MSKTDDEDLQKLKKQVLDQQHRIDIQQRLIQEQQKELTEQKSQSAQQQQSVQQVQTKEEKKKNKSFWGKLVDKVVDNITPKSVGFGLVVALLLGPLPFIAAAAIGAVAYAGYKGYKKIKEYKETRQNKKQQPQQQQVSQSNQKQQTLAQSKTSGIKRRNTIHSTNITPSGTPPVQTKKRSNSLQL